MITSAVEYVQQGYMVRSTNSDPMNSYDFLYTYLATDNNNPRIKLYAVNFIKENSQSYYDPQLSEFVTINLSDLQLDQYYKLSLRYEPRPPSTTYTNFMNLVKISYIFKITRSNNTYQFVGLPDNCGFDTQFLGGSINAKYHLDPNNSWQPINYTEHNSIIRLEPISNDDAYYNNITFNQSSNYSAMSGSYSNVHLASISVAQGNEVSFGNISFVIHNGQAETDYFLSLNYGAIPLSKFMPGVYYNITTWNIAGGGTTVWRIKVNDNKRIVEIYQDGVAKTSADNYFYFDKYGNATSGGNGVNRLYLKIVREWSPPNLSLNIDGALKTYSNGWVNIDGTARQIDKMWVNIDGVLKQI